MRLGKRLYLAIMLAASAGSTVCERAAAADSPQAKCFVRMIQALHDGGGPGGPTIDPKITRLRSYLEKAPFTAWKSFKLLDEKDMTVAETSTDRFQLPNGKQASLTYVDHVLRPDGKHRLRLRLEIEDGGKHLLNTTFVLDEGGIVLQAGQRFGAGLLILGFSCDVPND